MKDMDGDVDNHIDARLATETGDWKSTTHYRMAQLIWGTYQHWRIDIWSDEL